MGLPPCSAHCYFLSGSGCGAGRCRAWAVTPGRWCRLLDRTGPPAVTGACALLARDCSLGPGNWVRWYLWRPELQRRWAALYSPTKMFVSHPVALDPKQCCYAPTGLLTALWRYGFLSRSRDLRHTEHLEGVEHSTQVHDTALEEDCLDSNSICHVGNGGQLILSLSSLIGKMGIKISAFLIGK